MNSQSFFYGNGGGSCKTLNDVRQLTFTPVTHIEVGSITVKQRPGNSGDTFYCDDRGTTVNALGMPNPGIEGYREVLPHMAVLAHQTGKVLIANIAPVEAGDTAKLCQLCVESGVRFIMLNAGCPNVWSEGQQKLILSYDPDGLAREVQTAMDMLAGNSRITLAIKLSPYLGNRTLRRSVAQVLDRHPVWIASPNTIPNQYRVKADGQPAINFQSGGDIVHVGGLGGTNIQAMALQELTAFRQLLPNHPFISLGGISTGHDIHERLLGGAHGIQVASAYYSTSDNRIFGRMLEEYASHI